MFKEVFFGVAFLVFYGSATNIQEGKYVALIYSAEIVDLQFHAKYYVLGFENKIDPIQSVFGVCDIEKEDQGLTLSEVRDKRCMDYLASAFGITNDNIIKGFEAVDQDGDGVASKQETSSAFENLRFVGDTL